MKREAAAANSALIILLLITLLSACEKRPTEAVDNHFNDFIETFSSDSAFQVSRTKFPLKIKRYDIENDRDSVSYREMSEFKQVDFRRKKSTGVQDQWVQNIVVDSNNTSATLEIRGIDNGIMVDYVFEKIDGAWMLIEIEDRST